MTEIIWAVVAGVCLAVVGLLWFCCSHAPTELDDWDEYAPPSPPK